MFEYLPPLLASFPLAVRGANLRFHLIQIEKRLQCCCANSERASSNAYAVSRELSGANKRVDRRETDAEPCGNFLDGEQCRRAVISCLHDS